jgi:conjugal transfer pilus assembly protein TraK
MRPDPMQGQCGQWLATSTLARALALTVAMLTTRTACALQLLDARDGVSVEAMASIKEATRIRIEGAPITDVFGNIYSSTCATANAPAPLATGMPLAAPASPLINPAGELIVECDRDKGEVYIRPVGRTTKPVNLFISTAQATYTLLLHRSDTPADTIVIRDTSARPFKPEAPTQGPAGTSANHVRAMKALLVTMASDRIPADVRVEEVNRPVPLWVEASFLLMRRYEGRGLLGEKYLLRNTSAALMVLAEQEFDRDGAQVMGVAIENHNLQPGESTNVFVIRKESAR